MLKLMPKYKKYIYVLVFITSLSQSGESNVI